MTIVKIIETGELKELTITDPKTRLDWSVDILGNYEAFDGYEEDTDHSPGLPVMHQDTYDWWAVLLPRYESADEAVNEYRKELNDGGVGSPLPAAVRLMGHAGLIRAPFLEALVSSIDLEDYITCTLGMTIDIKSDIVQRNVNNVA